MEPEQNLAGTPNPLNPNPEAEALDANPSEHVMAPAENVVDPVDNVMGPVDNVLEPTPEPISEGVEDALGSVPELRSEPASVVVEPMVEPTPEPVSQVVEPVIEPAPKPIAPPRPANPNRPVDPMIPVQQSHMGPGAGPTPITVETPSAPGITNDNFQNIGVVTDMNGTPTDPMSRPMQKAVDQAPAKPKKKKTWLIVGAIICLFLAVVCGVAAALVLANTGKEDAVAIAIERWRSGEAPENMAIDGTIYIEMNDTDEGESEVADMQIELRSELVPKSMINSTEAKIKINAKNGQSFSLNVDEIYGANGDLYLKLGGITNLLTEGESLSEEADADEETKCLDDSGMKCATTMVDCESDSAEADCLEGESTETTGIVGTVMSMFEMIDDEWIKITTDELSQLSTMTASEETSCGTNLITDLNSSSNSLFEIYGKNPFITSTTKGLSVQSEKNPIYKVLLNSDKLTSFLDEAQNTTAIQNYLSCTTSKGQDELSVEEFEEKLSEMPEIYVEIDKDYNFTRFYTKSNEEDKSVTVDLDISYPTNVNIPEPTEYRDIAYALRTFLGGMFESTEIYDEEESLESDYEEEYEEEYEDE